MNLRRPFLALALALAVPLDAQSPLPTSNAKVREVLDIIKADKAWTFQQQLEIVQIPAPPFKESVRATDMKKRFEAAGLRNVRIDDVGNVIAERRGAGKGPTVLIEGHLDTVFPEGTDVSIKHRGDTVAAPGIGDDVRGLATVLSVARAFEKAGIQTNGTVYFVANVGEEGPGNLRGTRNLLTKELAGKIDYFITVDGEGLGIASRAVGSNRYKVTYKGPGGHSYGAFGIPNPIHALGRAMAMIADIQVPATPKTTFNVGVISGGTSVNSIPFEASMEVDMRSESATELANIDARIQKILVQALDAENARWTGPRAAAAKLSIKIDSMGFRPTGGQADAAPIVQTALNAAKSLGFSPQTSASSTDANIPISMGIPAIRLSGGGQGGGAHALDEWYLETANSYLGPQWAALVVTALAGVSPVGITP
jgi:tripeptide aminopeptidase